MTRRPISMACAAARASIERGSGDSGIGGTEQQMTDDFRYCPGCGSNREFVQVHPGQARCPDAAAGGCPEWFCTACGEALLIGAQVRRGADRLDRVA